jgi:TPR repeat protein
MYYTGLGTVCDLVAAKEWAIKSADNGVASAHFLLAQLLLAGQEGEIDCAMAREYLLHGARAGHVKSQILLADMLLEAGMDGCESEAKRWLSAAAALGSAEAERRLVAFILAASAGKGVDSTEAIEVVRSAARKDQPWAMCDLGMMYLQGITVDQDAATAKRWLKAAASKGSVSAQNNLGLLYAYGPEMVPGSGLKHNFDKAYRWFREAAEKGDPSSQFNLAMLYLEGKGLEIDAKRAIKWLKRAADQQHFDAALQLRDMYTNGTGVTKSTKKAAKWDQLSARLAPSAKNASELDEHQQPPVERSASTKVKEETLASASQGRDSATFTAAASGDADALYELAKLSAKSDSGPLSRETLELFEMASAAGSSAAQKKMKETKRNMLLRAAAARAFSRRTPQEIRMDALRRAAARSQ